MRTKTMNMTSDSDAGGIFRAHAPAYWSGGYSVVPIEPRSKRPTKEISGWSGYCDNLPSPDKRRDWLERFGNHGIGLLLGMTINGYRLSALDFDDDRLVPVGKAIFGEWPSGKRGKKGETAFIRAEHHRKVKSTALQDPQKAGKVDVLVSGKMTVLPPTLHPETGQPYEWTGQPLLDCSFDDLPVLDERRLELLKLIAGSEQAWVLMEGKTTHDAGVSLVAKLVSAGSSDDEIERIIRALLPPDYQGNSLEELPGWIASAREKGFGAAAELPMDEVAARIIEQELKPVVFVSGDGFLQYSEGFWQSVPDSDIERRAKELLGPKVGPKRPVMPTVKNVVGCLALNVENVGFGSHSGRICVLNGTVNVATGELEEHSPDHQLRYRLDLEYEPDAKCPTYEEQVQQTFIGNEKAVDLFDENAALTLVPDMRFQKALYLVGPGGSGKSTLLRVVESMHDPSAVSVTPLDRLDGERYLTDAARKLVCISFDVQTNRKIFGESFIRITGGDPVTVRKLYAEVEGRVIPTVRFLGSTNPDMPGFIAAPDALERRLILLPCAARIEQPDRNRFDRLLEERAGILARWVRALQRLYARGHFDIPAEVAEEVDEYVHNQDPFDVFVEERLVRDDEAKTPVSEITRQFNYWADDVGAAHLAFNVVGKKLRRLGFRGSYARAEGGQGPNQRTVNARLRSRRGPDVNF